MRNETTTDEPIAFFLQGCHCARHQKSSSPVSIKIVAGRIVAIEDDGLQTPVDQSNAIDLSGCTVIPGLINAHDHLHFALHPKLGNPPYRNYIEWGEDIHATLAETIATYKSIPREVRLWWGGLRNLLCGVTTVCHHDTLWSELQQDDFPVRVLQSFGWAHSVATTDDLYQAYTATPRDTPFFIHAGEGTDAIAMAEITKIDDLGLLTAHTVLIHGLAIDQDSAARIKQRRASLVLCPSSNQYLYQGLPPIELLDAIHYLVLGSDSPITATGDLLDEVRYSIKHCGINTEDAFEMITSRAASVLRLHDGEGTLCKGGTADIVAMQGTDPAAQRIHDISWRDVELVIIRGRIHLVSDFMRERIPAHLLEGLEPLWVDGQRRWLRAPVRRLLQQAEEVLGTDRVRMQGRLLRADESFLHDTYERA